MKLTTLLILLAVSLGGLFLALVLPRLADRGDSARARATAPAEPHAAKPLSARAQLWLT